MTTLKYSRQREAIKDFLAGRKDHPTADTVYTNMRGQFPNISLGTVYRNLALLSEIGEIAKISTGEGAERFDGNPVDHYHFVCTCCHSVSDLEMPEIAHINILAGQNFDGEIKGHVAYFYGLCGDCARKQKASHAKKSKQDTIFQKIR